MKISITGFMGSGKSLYGKQLANCLDLPFFDLDHYIEQKEKLTINEIFEQKGENYFRALEEKYLDLLIRKKSFVLSTGGGTIASNKNVKLLTDNTFVIFLNLPLKIIIEYLVKNKNQRPLIKDIPENSLVPFVEKLYQKRLEYYKKAHLEINPEKMPAEELAIYLKQHLHRNPL